MMDMEEGEGKADGGTCIILTINTKGAEWVDVLKLRRITMIFEISSYTLRVYHKFSFEDNEEATGDMVKLNATDC